MTDELFNLMHDPANEDKRAEEERKKKQEQEDARRFLERRREEDRRKEEDERRRQEILRQQQEVLREAENRKREEDRKRKEEEEKRLGEERRLADDRRKREEEQERQRKQEQEQKRFQEEQIKLEEEFQRRVADARKKEEEDKRRQNDEADRKRREAEAEERKRREEAEEKRRKEEELERRVREQLRKEMEEEERKKRAESELRRRLEEEDKKRREEEEVEAKLRAEAEKKQKEEAEKKRQEEEEKLRKEEEEKKRNDNRSEEEKKKLEEMQQIYQKKLEELEAKLRVLQVPAKEEQKEEKKEQAPQSPKVCLLVNESVAQARVDEAIAYLQEKAGVKKEEIQIVNASKDYDLLGVVKGQRDKLEFPMVLIRDSVVGTVEELKAYGDKGMLQAILAGQKPPSDGSNPSSKNRPAELQLSFLDHTVSFTVSTVQGLGTLVFLPIIAPYKLLSWAFGGSAPKPAQGVDVDVIQSNWYWRHQLRTLRFTDDNILRLRPGYEDIRAEHKYEDVKEIKLVDQTNLVITYRQGGSDYLRTTPDNMRRICDIITQRSKNPPAIIQPK
jgi:hypothetical protein